MAAANLRPRRRRPRTPGPRTASHLSLNQTYRDKRSRLACPHQRGHSGTFSPREESNSGASPCRRWPRSALRPASRPLAAHASDRPVPRGGANAWPWLSRATAPCSKMASSNTSSRFHRRIRRRPGAGPVQGPSHGQATQRPDPYRGPLRSPHPFRRGHRLRGLTETCGSSWRSSPDGCRTGLGRNPNSSATTVLQAEKNAVAGPRTWPWQHIPAHLPRPPGWGPPSELSDLYAGSGVSASPA